MVCALAAIGRTANMAKEKTIPNPSPKPPTIARRRSLIERIVTPVPVVGALKMHFTAYGVQPGDTSFPCVTSVHSVPLVN
jgi:hypothetical protein